MNIFRLPVGWQYLINNNLGGSLDSGNFGRYDQLVQACLRTGAYCMIDVSSRSTPPGDYGRDRGPMLTASPRFTTVCVCGSCGNHSGARLTRTKTRAGMAKSSARAVLRTASSPACGLRSRPSTRNNKTSSLAS